MNNYISNESLFITLKFLIESFVPLNNPWALTGSTGQYIQGMNLYPHDIDIQTDKAGAYAINKILLDYCI